MRTLTSQLPAERLVALFGTRSALAEAAGIHRATVTLWFRSRDDGGTGGAIPMRQWRPIIRAARERGITLTPADLIPLEYLTALNMAQSR